MAFCWMGLANCRECKTGIYEEGKNVVAEKGDTVKVEFEAEYTGVPMTANATADKHMLKVNGKETWVPKTATVTVVKKAVPAEPPMGSVVEFADGTVIARYDSKYWIELRKDREAYNTKTWEKFVEKHGSKYTPWSPPIKVTTIPIGGGFSCTFKV